MGQTGLEKQLVLGKIGAPHGIKGFVAIHSYTEPPDAIFNYPHWLIHFASGPKILELLEFRAEGNRLFGLFLGFEDRTQAQALRNLEISVSRDSLPELAPGEYYWADLLGLTVINEAGFLFGKITRLIETGANDVLVVQPEHSDALQKDQQKPKKSEKNSKQNTIEYLIPYIPEQVILSIDLIEKRMIVRWEPEF